MPAGKQSRKTSKSAGKQSRKNSKSGSAKSAKISLKEEELQKIEEEKQRQEEELAKQEQEQELYAKEKKRRTREKTEALKQLKPSQYERTLSWLDKSQTYMTNTKKEEKSAFEFEKFQRNGNRPDPVEVKSINTFLSLLKDKSVHDVKAVFGDVKLMMSLLDELYLTNRKYSDGVSEAVMKKREENVISMEHLIAQRYNDLTLKTLEDATFIVDSDTGNLERVCGGDHETILVWANLTRNPRMTGFEFRSENLSMDVPGIIALADVGIRILITKYDHYSQKCSTFYPKKLPEIQNDAEKGREQVVLIVENKQEGEAETPAAAQENEQSPKDGEPPEVGAAEGAAAETKEAYDESEEQVESVKEEQVEDDILDPDVVDLRQFTRLGQIFKFEILKMPPQPLVVTGGWTLTALVKEPLSMIKYPDDVIVKELPKQEGEPDGDEEGKPVLPKPPTEPEPTKLGVKMKAPEKVIFYEEPQLARWDPKDHHWKTSGFSDFVYDDVQKMISFQTDDFYTFCLLQDTHLNMPFQTWELRCTGENTATFSVIAACSENVFEIKDTDVRLMKPETGASTEFEHFYDKWMAPDALILLMQAAGNNIFPDVDSTNFVSVADKVIDIEPIYDQMAFLSPSFAFAWSRFSNDVRSDELVMQVIPVVNPTDNSNPIVEDPRAATYIIQPDRSYKLAVTEQMVRLSYDEARGCPCQTDLAHAVRMTPLSKDIKGELLKNLNKRVDDGDSPMVATVRYLLNATKVLTFS